MAALTPALRIESYRQRAALLQTVRRFFAERGALEVETPLLNSAGAFEAHLDSFAVLRRAPRKSVEAPALTSSVAGYLTTSPEYNLKYLLSELRSDIFQIAHCFREGDVGAEHREEFLMLEWYRIGQDEQTLIDECEELLRRCNELDFAGHPLPAGRFHRFSVEEIFGRVLGIGLRRAELAAAVADGGLLRNPEEIERCPYEELFHLLFLNRVEAQLPDGPCFLYDYPPELAALARIEAGRARRFELYWGRLELANGYNELTDRQELDDRLQAENALRRASGKEEMAADPRLFAAFDRGLPPCSGVSIGLDRLFLALLGETDLGQLGLLY